ncbi:MAG: hypothetical protein R3C10_22235 [Pirellulales bacterium]
MTHRENPFSVHRVQPGALDYIFDDGTDIEQLLRRLERNQWRGEVIGPHGSGKSTLLAQLASRFSDRGFDVRRVLLRSGERHLPGGWETPSSEGTTTVVVVDGMEQLGWLARRRLARHCRRQGWGLVATAHDSLGLPLLVRTQFGFERFEQVVRRLLVHEAWSVRTDELRQIYERFGGDMREMLFCLYDRYEADGQGDAVGND